MFPLSLNGKTAGKENDNAGEDVWLTPSRYTLFCIPSPRSPRILSTALGENLMKGTK